MKKLVSLLIALVLVVSALAFSVSAEGTTAPAGKDPTYAATDSKVIKIKSSTKIGATAGTWANTYNKDYADNNLNLNPAETLPDPLNNSADLANKLKIMGLNPMTSKYSVFCEKGSTDPEFNVAFIAELGTGETVELTKVSAIVFAVPGAATPIKDNPKSAIIDNISVYYSSTEDWKPVAAASATADNADVIANKANFKELFTAKDLLKEDSETKFTASADGSFRYYEVTLAEPIEAKYLFVCSNIAMYSYFTEFAAFSPAETATEPETTAAGQSGQGGQSGTTNPTTGDNTVIVLAVVAVVAIAGAAVVVRRKEHN